MTRAEGVLRELRAMGGARNVEGMRRFGIDGARMLGISVTDLRRMARRLGKDHDLALALWGSGIHEARILATIVAEPARTTARQMEAWARDFDSWDIVDQACGNLFVRTPRAPALALAWSRRRAEFQKRAGFSLMAALAVHGRLDDEDFEPFLAAIERECDDERNFVRKAINWALRQIGKRNRPLHRRAIATAERIAARDSRPARWIASDALRELRSEKVLTRLDASV
jgi:3-methyladenine DNA glycosylase AlkD